MIKYCDKKYYVLPTQQIVERSVGVIELFNLFASGAKFATLFITIFSTWKLESSWFFSICIQLLANLSQRNWQNPLKLQREYVPYFYKDDHDTAVSQWQTLQWAIIQKRLMSITGRGPAWIFGFNRMEVQLISQVNHNATFSRSNYF